MKLGYMTNAFGPLVGEGGGVTSIKDIRYLTLCDDEAVLKKITNAGFRYIEVLEGNLTKYGSDIQVLKDMLARYGAGMMSVCVGARSRVSSKSVKAETQPFFRAMARMVRTVMGCSLPLKVAQRRTQSPAT